MSIDYDALFDDLCRSLGFCSIHPEGQRRIETMGWNDPEAIARAVFREEGLDYDAYRPDRVCDEVRACIDRHLKRES